MKIISVFSIQTKVFNFIFFSLIFSPFCSNAMTQFKIECINNNAIKITTIEGEVPNLDSYYEQTPPNHPHRPYKITFPNLFLYQPGWGVTFTYDNFKCTLPNGNSSLLNGTLNTTGDIHFYTEANVKIESNSQITGSVTITINGNQLMSDILNVNPATGKVIWDFEQLAVDVGDYGIASSCLSNSSDCLMKIKVNANDNTEATISGLSNLPNLNPVPYIRNWLLGLHNAIYRHYVCILLKLNLKLLIKEKLYVNF